MCVSVGDLSKKISIFCANNHLASQNDSINVYRCLQGLNIDVILVYDCILNVKSDCLTSKDVARITSMLSIKEYPLQIESNTLLLWIWHPLSMRWCTADEITRETLIQITQMHLRITSVTDIVASFIYFFLFRLQLPVFIRLPVCIIIRGTIANSSVAHITVFPTCIHFPSSNSRVYENIIVTSHVWFVYSSGKLS